MNRHAILVVNSVDYEDSRMAVPATVVSQVTRDFSTKLRGLGDYSFQPHSITNKTLAGARRELESKLNEIEKEVDLLLLYYFGHAVADGDQLLLFFKDSKIHRNTSMMNFNEISRMVSDYGVPKTVFLLDCCYAGAAAINLAELNHQQYYLMASATPKQKALIDYHQKYPIGLFTNEIMRLIGTREASEFASREVTFRNIFNRAKTRIRSAKSGQDPQSRDAGTGDDIFFRVDRRPELRRGLNAEVHQKSLYWKLYKICRYLDANNFRSISSIYSFARPSE
jgi:Caspase domain